MNDDDDRGPSGTLVMEPPPGSGKPAVNAHGPTLQMDAVDDGSVPHPLQEHELDWGEEPRTAVKPDDAEVKTLLREPPIAPPSVILAPGLVSSPPSNAPRRDLPPETPPAPAAAPDAYGRPIFAGAAAPSSFDEAEPPPLVPPAPLPSTLPPGPPERRVGLYLLAGVGVGLVGATVAALLTLHREGSPAPPPSSASARAVASARGPSPTPVASSAPVALSTAPSASAASSAAPQDSPSTSTLPEQDRLAIAALEKLRDGIGACVKNTIHVLPGASPAVPSGIAWLKHGPYKSLTRDWVSPFFSCTRFQIEEPMPFMIQWQVEEPNQRGTGVVWVADEKGEATRAYAFTARLVKKEAEFGPIEPIDAHRPLQRPR